MLSVNAPEQSKNQNQMAVLYKLMKYQNKNLKMNSLNMKNRLPTSFSERKSEFEFEFDANYRREHNSEDNEAIKAMDLNGLCEQKKIKLEKDQEGEEVVGVEADFQAEQNINNDDQQMSTEYITQLCRFLAENAIKKRELEQRQQQQLQQQQLREQQELSLLSSNQLSILPRRYRDQAASTIQQQKPLADSNNKYLTGHQQYQQHQQQLQHHEQQQQQPFLYQQQQQQLRKLSSKRAILQKIRHQIFERKRQRQMAQLVVWRPW